jgi:hypothetical protein
MPGGGKLLPLTARTTRFTIDAVQVGISAHEVLA